MQFEMNKFWKFGYMTSYEFWFLFLMLFPELSLWLDLLSAHVSLRVVALTASLSSRWAQRVKVCCQFPKIRGRFFRPTSPGRDCPFCSSMIHHQSKDANMTNTQPHSSVLAWHLFYYFLSELKAFYWLYHQCGGPGALGKHAPTARRP